ncbi:MAG: divergent polysaccharide deacetylase family protein [Acetobacteraceae bacterium]
MPAGLWQFFAGWRGLGRFWLLIASVLAACGIALQLAGPLAPPGPREASIQAPARSPPPSPVPSNLASQEAVKAPPAQRPGRDTPGPVADPDPALAEPAPGSTSDLLPRIAADGRMPMQVYAAGFDNTTRRPRVGLLLAGVGLNQNDSDTAIRSLPDGVTLAISPYAQNVGKLLSAARLAEHEYLLSIPMEPQGFPLNDPGKQALMTNLSPEQNHTRLEWLLSRIGGYVGVTGAEGSLRGERFASLPDEINPILAELAQRGLLYVDPRPGAAPLPLVWSRTVDLVVDEPGGAADIDAKLAQLAQLAREKSSALGFAGAVRPVTTQRLAAWASSLPADGLVLAPVSALVRAPAAP